MLDWLFTLAVGAVVVGFVWFLLYPLITAWRHERQHTKVIARLEGRRLRFASPWYAITAAAIIVTVIAASTGDLRLTYRLALAGLVLASLIHAADTSGSASRANRETPSISDDLGTKH